MRVFTPFMCLAIAALCCLAAYILILHFRMDDGVIGLVSVSGGILRRRISVFTSWLTYGWLACLVITFFIFRASRRRPISQSILVWVLYGILLSIWLALSLIPARDWLIDGVRVLEARPYVMLASAPLLLLMLALITDFFRYESS